MAREILKELKTHAPFTFFGAFSGIIIMFFSLTLPHRVSYDIFYVLHPLHVFLSALVTAAMFGLHECGTVSATCIKGKCNFWKLLAIGYVGTIGPATISDSIIPYIGETMLRMPNRGIHLGFIEKWWLVNPLAILGIIIAYFWPRTKFPHAGHVLLSTWASLFHIIMATGGPMNLFSYVAILFFLFLAVWIPCCVSDIVFPLLFVKNKKEKLQKSGTDVLS